MRIKYYISLKTQFENMGDLLINREMIRILSTRGEVFINCRSAPADFIEKILSSSDLNCTPLETRKSLIFFHLAAMLGFIFKKNKYIFSQNPGGYGGEISKRASFRKNINTHIKTALSHLGIEFIAFGVSYDKIGPRHTAALKKQFSVYSNHFVRDESSFNYCTENKIKCDGILPDLAFNLDYHSPLPKSKRLIILSFRDLGNELLDNLLIESIKRNIMHITSKYQAVEISITYQVTFDKAFSEKILDALSDITDTKAKIIDLTKSLDENLSFYSKASFTLSNRLHVVLMSMSTGSKCYALTHPEKNAKLINLLKSESLESSLLSITDNTQLLCLNSEQEFSTIFKTNKETLNRAKVQG